MDEVVYLELLEELENVEEENERNEERVMRMRNSNELNYLQFPVGSPEFRYNKAHKHVNMFAV